MDQRLRELEEWLITVVTEPITNIAPASEDASFRRYFRVNTGTSSFIAMDAPPDKESLQQFLYTGKALIIQGVHAPQILHENQAQGFLLMEDLGNRTFLSELHDSSRGLYASAIDSLIKLQRGTTQQADILLPNYDDALLRKEMALFDDWYVQQHLQTRLTVAQNDIWQKTQSMLIDACLEQPQVWVHRDYHSRNLMITADQGAAVIDFQDMLIGPIAYDLASLFKDCYIEWPRATQHRWLRSYYDLSYGKVTSVSYSVAQLIRWVDFTGLQRHLKVLGIFSRLNYRDKKPGYLADLPLVNKYVAEVLDLYPEFSDFRDVLANLESQ